MFDATTTPPFTSNTKTCPKGRVFDVQREGYGQRAAKHEEHVPEDVFFVFNVGEPEGVCWWTGGGVG